METMTTLPFWLQVKKEYVIENFNELLEYLSHYQYNPEAVDPSMKSTLQCMLEITESIGNSLIAEDAFTAPRLDIDPVVAQRLVTATLLACRRCKYPHDGVALTLIGLVTALNPTLPPNVVDGLTHLAINLSRNAPLDNLNVAWTDLRPDTFTPTMLAFKLSQSRCGDAEPRVAWIAENAGLMVIPPKGNVAVAALNLRDYTKTPLKLQAMPISGFEIKVPEADYEKMIDFPGLYTLLTSIIHSQAQVKPAPRGRLRDYNDGDLALVAITAVSNFKIVAETVNPAYNCLTGNLHITTNSMYRPAEDLIRRYLKPGVIVRAAVTSERGKTVFNLTPVFEDFYRSIARQYENVTVPVRFNREYGTGSQWVSNEGIRIAFDDRTLHNLDAEEQEFMEEAVSFNRCILMQTQGNVIIDCEKCYIYAAGPMIDDEPEPDEKFTISEADTWLIKEFINTCTEEAESFSVASTDYREAPALALPTLTRLVAAATQLDNLSATRRLELQAIGAMLSNIAGDARQCELFMHAMRYLSRIVAFAASREVRPLDHPESLADSATVAVREQMIELLRGYRTGSTTPLRTDAGSESAVDRIGRLVSASNNLIDIIDKVEIDNIKHGIARALGVDDQYVPILDSRTWYGKENVALEFKKSIVFPPLNRRRSTGNEGEPEVQKWAIIKAVCGFLNSRSGGTLLLGVNDEGYADGIDDDIAELFRLKLIDKPDSDAYTRYVQAIINSSFSEYGQRGYSTDITRLTVTYAVETNDEKRTILRIDVRPYPYAAVRIAASGLPDDYQESYVRGYGQNDVLTPALRDEVNRFKLQSSNSSLRDLIALRNAVESRSVVALHDYESTSGTATRNVEVYKVWMNHGLIYGYDIDRRAPRLFKVTRCSRVEVTDRHWTSHHCAASIDIDLFGCRLDPASASEVELAMTDYARRIAIEELPGADNFINRTPTGRGASRYPWTLRCRISTLEGIARFVMSLSEDISVAKGDQLKHELSRRAHLITDI